MAEPVIDITHAEKRYTGLFGRKPVHALRGISLSVQPGEIFGLLGPNGAGKSTLVKLLLTVIRPTKVEGTLLGKPIGHTPTLAKVGYLPEHHKFPEHLTASQVLRFFAALAGVPEDKAKKRADELLERVGIADWSNRRVGTFSKGMRQRLGLANALAADPDVVILDEPTDGVDPVGRRDIRALLVELKQEGKAVMINSHLLSELELCCDRVAIMLKGQVRAQGTLDSLTKDKLRYRITLAPGINAQELLGASPVEAELLDEGRTVSLRTEDAAAAQPVIDAARAKGWVVETVRPVKPSLEDLFIEAVTDSETGSVAKPGADL